MVISYLKITQVEKINASILNNSEKAGFLNKGSVEFVLDQVKQLFDDLPERDAIIGKASYLLYHIANNQYFISGNKRTAFTIADTFLIINRIHFDFPFELKCFITNKIAQNYFSLENVTEWLKKTIKLS